jgi:hypothetical protein
VPVTLEVETEFGKAPASRVWCAPASIWRNVGIRCTRPLATP